MPRVIDMIKDQLFDAGIEYVFGVPGGCSNVLLETLYMDDRFTTVITRHEAAAAIMADMYGRITRRPGVVIGQGPFIATNGGLGIIEAYHAGVPMVIITETSDYYGNGQQACYQSGVGEYGTPDIRAMFKAMTKYTTYATEGHEAVYGTQLAIKHAISGRPGPACVLIRWNAMMAVIKDESELAQPIYPLEGHLNVSPPCISDDDAHIVANLLIAAEKPVMICGRGAHASMAYDEIQEIAELLDMPIATTYMGKSAIPETHDLAIGVVGNFIQKLTEDTIRDADVIVALGTCLAPDNTNNCSPEFIDVKRQKIIHIDIDPRNAGWTYPITIGVTSDAKLALRKVINTIRSKANYFTVDPNRLSNLLAEKSKPENKFYSCKDYDSEKTPIDPEAVVKIFNEIIDDEYIVLDAGNNRVWFTRLFQSKKVDHLIGSGGVAAMGWGVNAVLGAQIFQPDKKCIGITGDGCFLMSLHALKTAKEYNLPITFVVLNDESLGNVRDVIGRKARAYSDIPDMDFAAYAKSLGIMSRRVENYEDLRPALEEAIKTKELNLVDIKINPKASHLRIRKG